MSTSTCTCKTRFFLVATILATSLSVLATTATAEQCPVALEATTSDQCRKPTFDIESSCGVWAARDGYFKAAESAAAQRGAQLSEEARTWGQEVQDNLYACVTTWYSEVMQEPLSGNTPKSVQHIHEQ